MTFPHYEQSCQFYHDCHKYHLCYKFIHSKDLAQLSGWTSMASIKIKQKHYRLCLPCRCWLSCCSRRKFIHTHITIYTTFMPGVGSILFWSAKNVFLKICRMNEHIKLIKTYEQNKNHWWWNIFCALNDFFGSKQYYSPFSVCTVISVLALPDLTVFEGFFDG